MFSLLASVAGSLAVSILALSFMKKSAAKNVYQIFYVLARNQILL